MALSTHPTFSGGHLEPRALDLRVFVLQARRGSTTDVDVLPAALSRVAPAGSLIVNSSRGGGAKDFSALIKMIDDSWTPPQD